MHIRKATDQIQTDLFANPERRVNPVCVERLKSSSFFFFIANGKD